MNSNSYEANESAVPCNGCTRCCQGDAVRLLPGDDWRLYKTVPHEWMKGELMLDHKATGECIYLGDAGCTIHEQKPRMCREMDCRNIAARITYTQARKQRIVPIFNRGRELLRAESSLNATGRADK